MDDFVSALKSNDLVKAKKAFGAIMLERTSDLISQRKVEIAQSIMIEGEETEKDFNKRVKDDDKFPDGGDEDKKGKKSDDDADEGDDDEDEDD